MCRPDARHYRIVVGDNHGFEGSLVFFTDQLEYHEEQVVRQPIDITAIHPDC